MSKMEFIEAGRITTTHGIAGEIKIEVWLDSPAYLKKFPCIYIDKNEYKIDSASVFKHFLIVKLSGISSIEEAMRLKGKTVYIARKDAKLAPGQFFLCDIIGSRVVDTNGNLIGVLEDILERPSSNIYVVRGEAEHLIPAVDEFILSTDIDSGTLTVKMIEGM